MKSYPSREKDRWEHALARPLTRRTKFEVIELMRADLFEYLDVLTTCPYDDDETNESRARDLERVARRLAELTPRRAKALCAALKAGRVQHQFVSGPEADRIPPCGPYSLPIWEDVYRIWENAQ